LHKFCKETRRSPKGCFECRDTTHFIIDYPKRKKLDYNKGDNKMKNHFGDKKKKKFQNIIS
jgi:hypothetical protein